MAKHNELGKNGEEEAVRYLKSKGYKILEQNWRFRGYEIDIIAEDENYVVFVEVKTRATDQYGDPSDFVNKARMRRMVNAAHYYLLMSDVDKEWRFDIVGLIWDDKSFELEHIEDAFLPDIS